jgi:NAD(P)H-hydrate epimerase
MRRADEGAIDSGTPAEVLMERAGAAVARAALRLAGGRYGRRAVAVCGKGNNGGDGYAAARILRNEGMSVRCYSVADPGDLTGAARHHFELYRASGGDVDRDPRVVIGADVVIDAIFGTGFHGPADGESARAIEAVNELGRNVVSVDIPSGVDGSTGHVDGPAVHADVTVVMAAEKLGTALPPGAQRAGRVEVVDIGIAVDGRGAAYVLDAPVHVPRLDPTAHKRSEGSVAILAGSDAMRGAALLAARGAQRAGSGYVTLGVTRAVKDAAHPALPEALVMQVTELATLGRDSLEAFHDVIESATAVAIGPGIGQGPRQRELMVDALATIDKPLVLDADALNVLAGDPSPLEGRTGNAEVVLTPHPAELARLLGTSTEEVEADRLGSAGAARDRFGAVIVLKGWRTVIAGPSGLAVCPTGGPELATAGTGDVLTGAIAGLGGGAEGAAAGVYVHGLAGSIAGERVGPSGVVAWDVAEALPEAWERIAAGERADWLS